MSAQQDDLWEDFCLHVATFVVQQLPGIVDNGINQWSLNYPPLTNLALPAVNNYDTSQPLTGFCGIGTTDIGNGILSLSGLVLNGLDTIAMTAGQSAAFTAPDVTMTIPLTVGQLTVAGNFQMQHACQKGTNPQFTMTASGTMQLTISNANVVVTIGGLDQNAGSAGSVTIDWAPDPNNPTAPPAPPVPVLDPPTFSSTTPVSARITLGNYFKLSQNVIVQKIQPELTGLLTGTTSIGSGQTLAGELLSYINQAFNNVPLGAPEKES